MDESRLLSYSQVSLLLGISRHTVADLVLAFGLAPKQMASQCKSPKAKGLDASDIATIRKALRLTGASSDRVSA